MKESLAAGTLITHYRILSKIGAGGMGEVYLAEDTRLDRQVALKLLPAEFTQDADRVRRFIQEAKAASALNHPHIVTIHEIGEADAGRFIVMELVQGQTLRTMPKPCAPDLLVNLGCQIARALTATHAAGITHRDIKPDNIMLRDDGYVKVLDFGLARLMPATATDSEAATLMQQTTPGSLLGTVAYMSPEQARGEPVTHATDIFALGIVFYELATGQHPFKADSLVGMLHAINSQTPAPLARLNPGLPVALDSLILRMLEKDARLRPTAAEVDQALGELTGRSGSGQLQRPAAKPAIERHTVGREKERAELRAGFESAMNGRGQLFCVAGEPGIGKTTLVEDFLAELAVEGQCTIARGRCSERLAGTEAYLPLLEALESLLQSGSNPAIARVLKQIAPTWYAQVVPLSGESEESARLLAEVKAASQERMKRELGAFLQEVARLRPLVLFFDDLHWADVSTIDVLSFLASKFDALNVLIVVTYRPSDMLLAKHPFLQIKPDLQAHGVCRELALEFLNEAEIAEYLALEFPQHGFPAEFPKLIHAKTEGSPLFMADLVRYLRDRGVIRSTDFSLLPTQAPQTEVCATWTLAQALPDIEHELPESVRGMIERKIAQLSEDDRKLLTAASVQGYEFDSAVVAQALNLDADEIEERLEKLERVFAFVKLTSEAEFPNGTLTLRYRFVHVLYQNALYASLRATRKATLSRDVALALEACYGARSASVANELALLWEAARDYARASDSFLQAARNAAQINAHREAVPLAERGLEALLKLPETPERDRRELGLQLTRGFSLQSALSWAAPEAGVAFNRARQLCQQMGDDPRLFAALGGVVTYHLIRAEYETAQGLCAQMLQLAEQSQDPVLLVRASNVWAAVHYWQGEFVSAQQQGERALALDRREYHEAYLSIFNEDLGITSRRNYSYSLEALGYADRALALAYESITLAEQMSHPFSLGSAHMTTGNVFALRRDWPSSQQEYEKVVALAEEYALGDWPNYATTHNALNLAYQEPTEAAIKRAKQAIESLRAKGVMLSTTRLLARLGEVFGLAGRCAEGLATIAEALALVEGTGERFYEAEIWRIKGELLLKAAASNSQAEAESCYHRAIEIARQQSAKSWELRTAISLARLWQQQGKRAEARQMLAEIYGWFTEGFATADLKEAKALLEECGTGSVSDLPLAEAHDLDASGRSRSPYRTEASPSIAVLPFVNISNDPDNEYFCDGLAEELLNALSKIEALHVAARTSSFSFKGKETDIREIGQKLNVGAVLEGSVRKAGNRLRITAQLVNIADGYHLWSERYDREMQDIFDIQDEISLAIVDALKVKLLGEEKEQVLKRRTENNEVYQLYLKGRFFWNKRTGEALRKAIGCFQEAIDIDPNYALAWAGLADSELLGASSSSPKEAMPKAKAAVVKALELDDGLAEAHASLARIKMDFDWDWAGAEREFKRALELNPNYATAHQWYANCLLAVGRMEEALAEITLACEMEPFSLILNCARGWVYYMSRQYDRAVEQYRRTLEMEPHFVMAQREIALVYEQQGKYEEALAAIRQAMNQGGENPIVLCVLGHILATAGQEVEARKVIAQLQAWQQRAYLAPQFIAVIHAALGEPEPAIEGLWQAYEDHSSPLMWLKVDPWVDSLRAAPRFADLLRRIGLPE